MSRPHAVYLSLPVLLAACRGEAPTPADCIELPPSPMDLGFDRPFTLRWRSACGAGPVTWRQVAGPAVALHPAGGVTVTGRTPSLAEARGEPAPWGVIPFSPRTRGELVFVVGWQAGGQLVEREVRLAAAARSRGLPNVPVGARVHLGGPGWTLAETPPGSAVATVTDGFVPDVTGQWRLTDGAGRELRLHSGRYDETPLDCGRSGCHEAATAASATSRMTTVLARRLSADHDPPYPGCAVACHATGEPGLADGGFTHVAAELERPLASLAGSWAELPRPLRRLGGAGCLACHGPGAVPEESARWSILRTDVCATCHDAPPRYGHVEAWRRTRMASADRDPRTRQAECARCHTTAGYLASLGGHSPSRQAPPQVGATGLGCVACHAVHPAGPPAAGLLRAPPTELGPLPPGAGKSAPCLGCHTPGSGERPLSSAAALWIGRGGLDPRSGQPLVGPAPHGLARDGCLSCHRAGPAALARGASHAFAAPPSVCTGCHGPRPAGDEVRARALRLGAALGLSRSHPPHATLDSVDRHTPRGRAAWNVRLVLEDAAAAAHNAPYARRLLDTAEEALR